MTTLARQHARLPCGWCGTTNAEPNQTNCVNCGGPLPPSAALALDDPGPPPPPGPRNIPSAYRHRLLLWKNPLALVGAIFTIVFCWSIIFPIIGLVMWYFGHKKAQNQLNALVDGVAGRAELIEVFRDSSVNVNGRSPWRLVYTFTDQHGEVHEGWVHSWQAVHSRRPPGEAFWVVYMPDDPDQNAVWPPVR